MITLDLNELSVIRELECWSPAQDVSLTSIETRLNVVLRDLATLIDDARKVTVLVPSDLLFQAASSLFPVERMGLISERSIGNRRILGLMYDVTGVGHRAHVRADAGKLTDALVQIDRSGARLGAWIHSHPGASVSATSPSGIDRDQYADWTRDYSSDLIGIIVAADGFVRFWGDAVESGNVRVEIVGDGVTRVKGQRHVYRIV